jgi:signal transduction histidine kinase
MVRPKLFLTFAAICITPLLVLSLVNFYTSLDHAETLLQNTLDRETQNTALQFEGLVEERERELKSLANVIAKNLQSPLPGSPWFPQALSNLPPSYVSIAVFDANKKVVLLAEMNSGSWSFRDHDFIQGSISPDQSVWTLKAGSLHPALIYDPKAGDVLRCSLPLYVAPQSSLPDAALVADLKLDQVLASIDRSSAAFPGDSQTPRLLMVLDSDQRIVYHPMFRNRDVNKELPHFSHIAAEMTRGTRNGSGQFNDGDNTWMVSYQPLAPGLSVAVARNYSSASQPARRAGWLGVGISLVLGSIAALVMNLIYQRRPQSLHRVTASVAAIAGGKLDEDILLRSSDDLRILADNVNLMTEKLRDQLAREAESRQFDSFVKLSAMLAHDLKNAIEGLSLMVGNMDRHFDDPTFRTDSMNALTASTNKLKRLVARLSNPVNTLSGEYKLPRPTDLVPLLKRVIEQIAEPKRGLHEIVVDLPTSLFAIADGERVEKVMENLVLNALEAMGDVPGKLSIIAGRTEDSKIYFSVSDTGPGMSADFLKHKLFRPFSTTKRQGIGLGLYTCREVLRTNNGTITAESVPGSGTSFRVVLASAQLQ